MMRPRKYDGVRFVKQSVYLPDEMCTDVRNEARRQDRTVSWLVVQSWLLARDRIRQLPAPAKIAHPRFNLDKGQGGK